MKAAAAFCALLATWSVGCATSAPPMSVVRPREPTAIAASFSQAWNAVIDQFADYNIPIATLERASGFIATSNLSVGGEGYSWASCGKSMGVDILPAFGTYNVVVRGDSVKATVKVTARWSKADGTPCTTSGTWEEGVENRVRDRAEGRPIQAIQVRTPPRPEPKSAHTLGRARLVKAPFDAADLLDIIPKDSPIIILSSASSWTLVAWGKFRGYIRTDLIRYDK